MSNPIYMKLKRRRDNLDNVDASKFLGDPVIPAELDADSVLGDDEIFLCQLDCAAIAPYDTQRLLPDSGWLWFFVDIEEYPYAPRVIYSVSEPEFVLEEYNEEWVENTSVAYGITFSNGAKDNCGAVLLGSGAGQSVTLLTVDTVKAKLGVLSGAGGALHFVIDRDDLAARDFSRVRLIIG